MIDPPVIRRLHHIAVAVRDCDASTAFYRDVLGFVEVERPPFSFRGAWLVGHGLQMHVIEHESPRVAAGRPIDTRADHFALAVDDLDAAEAFLRDRGVAYHRQINAGGIPQIFFHDPDGHEIEFGIYPPDPPPI